MLQVEVGPNPSAGDATVAVTSDTPGTVRLRLVDARGRTVWAETREAVPSEGLRVGAAALAPGVYTLVVETPAGSATRRLVVSR